MIFKGKKGFVNPFDISGRLGYYIITIMIITVLFMFLAVLLQGSTVKYYKSNYGAAVINIEERAFNLLEYQDDLTYQKYTKVIDLEKFDLLSKGTNCDSKFNKELGVSSEMDNKAVKVEFYIGDVKGKEISTCNFVEERFDIEKDFPVLYVDGDEYKLGEVKMYFWKP